ncbi:S-adenosyl-L-methionine-dependent methyltransferase [Parathielavia hyrcaniae]|uniref:S-adenosyl-L-methionine-dependent methyltransferase n=1 Tax=Parathielavia hyrcaniae TaxID=113614 RepID=A0AAN6Q2A9_9PEZI|nr:S-adenosyl-L-methionine-dependent methyltransferase [Parathielavia hyrcaniae]
MPQPTGATQGRDPHWLASSLAEGNVICSRVPRGRVSQGGIELKTLLQSSRRKSLQIKLALPVRIVPSSFRPTRRCPHLVSSNPPAPMMESNRRDSEETLVEPDPQLKTYYDSLESRIGYRLMLGGTRHFGYYEDDTYWPFPLGKALRAMEEKLFGALRLPAGSQVLDAGCGVGHVALYMARRGLRVTAIDVMDHHVAKAKRNVAHAADLLPGQVAVHKMDYHHLGAIPSQSHDGVYTMETFVHATDPDAVLAEFRRVLRPGGRLVLHEYDHTTGPGGTASQAVSDEMSLVNKYTAMYTNDRSRPGLYRRMLEDAGFVDVVVDDYSLNIRPMLRLFFVLAVVPYFFIKLFHLEPWFINTVAGANMYLHQDHWRYLAIRATKPGPPVEGVKTK